MAYTAEVISKNIVNGLLKVEVKFTDGSTSFIDRYETRSTQDSDWLKNNIQRRLDDLNGIYSFIDTIPLGTFNPENVTEKITTPTTEKLLYKTKLEEFEKYVSAIKKGIISDTNADFLACQQWLKDNFSSENIDLF